MKTNTMLAVIFAAGLVAGCQTTQDKLIETGAKPLTKVEVEQMLTGKTVVWKQGGAFYGTDGSLETLWKGTREGGTWKATDAGEVCWQVASWEDVPCEAYFHDGDRITWVYKGKSGPMNELRDGNVIGSL